MTTETDTLAGLAEACIDSVLNISKLSSRKLDAMALLESAMTTEREISEVLWPRFSEDYVCEASHKDCFSQGYKHYAGMFTTCFGQEDARSPAAYCFWHAFLLQFLQNHKEECHPRS